MLGKLIKYELKASMRSFLPLYIGTLVIAVFYSLSLDYYLELSAGVLEIGPPGNTTGNGILFLLLFALCIAIVVFTIMTIVQRFNHGLLGNEGYLMFTLPVSHTQLLWSKLLTACIWGICSTLVMSVSGLLTVGTIIFQEEFWAIELLQTFFGQAEGWLRLIIVSANVFSNLICFILVIYLALMIGQTERFNQHRLIASVIAFFIIHWLFSAVDSVTIQIVNYIELTVYTLSVYSIIFHVIQGIICFVFITLLMRKKLNL